MIARREILAGSVAAALANFLPGRPAGASDWPTLDPAEAGFDPNLRVRLDAFIRGGDAPNIHSIVLARHGRLILEQYYEGNDQVRDATGGTRAERVAFTAMRTHELRSVTKSIVGLLYGIALREGKVPPIDRPLLAQFPQLGDVPDMAQRRRWTIAHALTMTLGIEWDESVSYDDPRNGQTAMEAAPDRYRYVLERPIVAVAGERWIYCGGATALIGKIIENGTRQPLPDYARRVLFDPLGIGPTEWRSGGDGERNFASGLGMRPRDLARIGQMLLEKGKAADLQVVPETWLAESVTPAVRISERRQYGRHWYLGDSTAGSERWIAAMGNGGQRLAVFPALDLVAVVTAGNYNQRDSASDRAITELVLPSVR
jgi:CubicO group peptidase (beta-lactamase class C family)